MEKFTAYAVIDETCKVALACDTFPQAVEAAEAYAFQVAQEKAPFGAVAKDEKSLAVVTADAKLTQQKYYGRWNKYDEKEGTAELELFFLRVKEDGYIMSGSIKEKHVLHIKVQAMSLELFDGVYAPYDAENYDGKENVTLSADEQDDDGSDDETYKP